MLRGTYKDAGVDVDAGQELVERIKPIAARTAIGEAPNPIGGFAALCGLPDNIEEPILVSGTDGVGTKLKVAFAANRHDTVGIDLVAMAVNDVITTGARPLFFLDYFATSKLEVDTATRVIEGIGRGCELAGCALLGGETAELPGMYQAGEYDLAGFAVGVVDRSKIVDGRTVQSGDAIIGLASDGLHSNGYALARNVLLEGAGLRLEDTAEGLAEPLVDALLRPTRIYARAVREAVASGGVRAMCHVTGGGLVDNLPRVLPEGLGARLDTSRWEVPPIFGLIERRGAIEQREMRRTFNMGIGFAIIVEAGRSQAVVRAVESAGERANVIGEIAPVTSTAGPRVVFTGS